MPTLLTTHVDAAECAIAVSITCLIAGFGGDIGRRERDPGARHRRFCNAVSGLLQCVFTARANHDVRAFRNQRRRSSKSKTAASAGNDRDLTCQSESPETKIHLTSVP